MGDAKDLYALLGFLQQFWAREQVDEGMEVDGEDDVFTYPLPLRSRLAWLGVRAAEGFDAAEKAHRAALGLTGSKKKQSVSMLITPLVRCQFATC